MGAHEVHLRDDPSALPVVDHEVVGADGAQAHAVRRVGVGRPEPPVAGPVEDPFLLEHPEQLFQVLVAETFPLAEGQLEGGALEVLDQDLEVLRIDQTALGRPFEEVVRVLDDELVDGGRVRHQHRRRGSAAASRPSRLLPGGGDRSRVAGDHRDVEAADVDAQFQRVRGDDAEDAPVLDAVLDLPPLLRQVSAAVAADPVAPVGSGLDVLLQVLDEHLGLGPGAGEHDRLQVALQETPGDPARLAHRRAADSEFGIHHRGVVEQEEAFRPGGAAPFHEGDGTFGEPLRQLARVGDGGGTENELGRRAVVGAHPAEPAEQVGQMAAEHPAVGVHLVDHDEAQVLEELGPLRVVGEDARMEHVRVRDDDVRPGADAAPGVARGVPVVDVGADVLPEQILQIEDLLLLVLRERLGGEEIERAGVGLPEDPVEDRRVVAKCLAGSGRRDRGDVLSRLDPVEHLPLVGIERFDAPAAIRVAEAGVDVLRKVPVVAGLRRKMAERGDSPERGARLQFGDQRPDCGAPLGRRERDAGAGSGPVLQFNRFHGLGSGAGGVRSVQESLGRTALYREPVTNHATLAEACGNRTHHPGG